MPQVEFRTLVKCSAYRIGSDGSVWSLWKRIGRSGGGVRRVLGISWNRLSDTLVDDDGYRLVTLFDDMRQGKRWRTCRLVCTAFHGPCPQGKECRHLNGNPADDAASNLTWGTHIENCADKIRHGRSSLGGRRKLTNTQVVEIRAARGTTSQRNLAREFGICQSQVWRIHKGISWRSSSEQSF